MRAMSAPLIQRLHKAPANQNIALALAGLTLVMQFMVALLVAPVVQTIEGDDGTVTVVLCNVQGERYTTLDIPDLASDGDDWCPALVLGHITGTAALAHVDVGAFLPEDGSGYFIGPISEPIHQTRFPDFIGRAPPLS